MDIKKNKDQYIKRAKDSRNWGPAKSAVMQGIKAGIDFDDEEATQRFMHEQMGILPFKQPASVVPLFKEKKVGRNEPCSCGSGKKYKHCCGK